ncbi:GNAT family N-acetyltransferase [Planktotalea frisia]|uniref:GNAT family N-acetyltransferase n=1 Tax=Planktotalea frisia TaxID=696762 RepID=UPI002355DD91|nr:GNAT family protein [Planktotalea frisia]
MTVRPVGALVSDWTAPNAPAPMILEGRYCRLEPLSAEKHAALLFNAFVDQDELYDYLPAGPFHSAAQYHRWVREVTADESSLFFAVYDVRQEAYLGVLSYLRISPAAGSIEVGNINFSKAMQRSPVSTEAIYLTIKWAFDAGYRRFEWKCNALNKPSRQAAQRLGFSYEGVFRQALVVKGRNRDTAWFAMIDKEWPALKEAYRVWLDPANFDADGKQRERLGDLTGLVRFAGDPTL